LNKLAAAPNFDVRTCPIFEFFDICQAFQENSIFPIRRCRSVRQDVFGDIIEEASSRDPPGACITPALARPFQTFDKKENRRLLCSSG